MAMPDAGKSNVDHLQRPQGPHHSHHTGLDGVIVESMRLAGLVYEDGCPQLGCRLTQRPVAMPSMDDERSSEGSGEPQRCGVVGVSAYLWDVDAVI